MASLQMVGCHVRPRGVGGGCDADEREKLSTTDFIPWRAKAFMTGSAILQRDAESAREIQKYKIILMNIPGPP